MDIVSELNFMMVMMMMMKQRRAYGVRCAKKDTMTLRSQQENTDRPAAASEEQKT